MADRLIDEDGADGFSLREVARRAGVSAPAAYRHFRDKEALLAAVAKRGFEDFAAALKGAKAAPGDQLAVIGQTYVRFAVARPGRFRLMYGRAISNRSKYPDLELARMASVDALRAAIPATPQASANPAVTSLKLWCLVHGLSQLILDGMLAGHDVDTLARAVTSGAIG
ncbi:MAG: TetR/AcrR family transcriptional regulator [Gammaproteobacteria bacterium]